MSLSSIAFLCEEAFRNIRRNGLMSLAALTTVAISMAVLGGSLFALYRLHQFAEAQPRQFEIVVFLYNKVAREDAAQLQKRLSALPGVASVHLVPREEALVEMEEEDKRQGRRIVEALAGENPLPDRLDVRLSDPKQTAAFTALLRNPDRFPQVETVRDDRETLDRLIATSRLIRNVGGIIALLLFIATAFVIQNTIRLTVFARRREIRIMQLVGATSGFIRFPLVLEGIFYGVAGSVIASGTVILVLHQISAYVGRFQTPLAQGLPQAVKPLLIVAFLAALGAIVGWLGSALSIRRFLKRI
jgi:cell division transport system permease protein